MNFIAVLSPALLAIVAIPPLVTNLGTARFGVLALTWTLVGSFGIFDLGLGRALTQEIAARLGRGAQVEIPGVARAYLRLLAITGVVGGAVATVLAPAVALGLLNMSDELADEAAWSFALIGLSLPAVIVSTGLRGVLEAYQRFRALTAIRVPMNAATFLGPLAMLPISHHLAALTSTLIVSRIAGAIAYAEVCRRTVPGLFARRNRLYPLRIRQIWRFARWMAITNVLAPVLIQIDRFAIGIALSASAVAFYAAPSDVITRFAVIPLSVVGVLYPAMATSHALDPSSGSRLFDRGCRGLLLLLVPPALVVFAYAHEVLDVWLGPQFAEQSDSLLRWLCLGVVINSIGQVPFAFIQAVGRPDRTAWLHMAEVPLYLMALALALAAFGLEGVAIAWSLRALFDTVAMFLIARRSAPVLSTTASTVAAALAAAFLPSIVLVVAGIDGVIPRAAALALGVAALGFFATRRVVHPTGPAPLHGIKRAVGRST
jgi:O-antigen/teichoic acid export membrane protein